jgi:hypothetical protein
MGVKSVCGAVVCGSSVRVQKRRHNPFSVPAQSHSADPISPSQTAKSWFPTRFTRRRPSSPSSFFVRYAYRLLYSSMLT